MPIDLSKLKKKQLVSLISKKDDDLLSLQEQVNQLKLDVEQGKLDVEKAKEENPQEIKVTTIHQVEIEYYEERISNCIHKDLVKLYQNLILIRGLFKFFII